LKTYILMITSMVAIGICIADSSLLRFAGISNIYVIINSNLVLFSFFISIFGITNLFLLYSIAKGRKQLDIQDKHSITVVTSKWRSNSDFWIVSLVQIVILGILVVMLFQMTFTKTYYLIEVLFLVYCSFTLAFTFIFRLTLRFYKWYRSKQSRMFLLYCILFVIILTNYLVFLSYVSIDLSYHSMIIKPVSTRMFFASLYDISPYIEGGLNFFYDILTFISFIVAWITTVILLKSYSKKIGLIKYWILSCIPLVYFLSRYDLLINPLIQYLGIAGVQFSVPYLTFLSATQQIGGIMFGIYYWVVSSRVLSRNLKDYLVLSGIGMMFIFGSNEIQGLLISYFPPFGLITVLFMGLGSYLLFLGLFELAAFVARNSEIRTAVNKTIGELSLVKNIGRSEIERIVGTKVARLAKIAQKNDTEIKEYEFDNEELKEMVEDIINEVHSSKRISYKDDNDNA